MNKIPTIFKPSGVSYHKTVISKLKKGDIVKMELDENNKYDSNAIKILTQDDEMCGFVPKKYKLNTGEEFILNVLIKKKFDKLSRKYNLKVHEIYEWDGPTGIDLIFEKKNISNT